MAIPVSTGRAQRAMRTEATVNLSDAAVAQVMIPVDDFERGIAFYLRLAEFTDPDGNPLALMSEVALAGAAGA